MCVMIFFTPLILHRKFPSQILSNRNCLIDWFMWMLFMDVSFHSLFRLQPKTTKASDGFKFKWNSMEQNIILGSFFWGYVLTELPGGRLAELIGGHRVFGHSMLWASVLTLITPCAAFIDYKALVIVRALLGFMLGKSNSFIQLRS